MSAFRQETRCSLPRRFWRRLCSPAARLSLGSVLLLGFAAGIVFWGGLHVAVGYTNTERFCISCHEMYDGVYQEYRQTIHYSNRTGVRAVCADCHVPKDWGPMMVRKLLASRELWGKLVGSVDTPEKFASERLRLARREWRRMLANDSLECRNCHGFESMAGDRQAARATGQHQRAVEQGMSCIQCHQGIAHRLPADMADADYLD